MFPQKIFFIKSKKSYMMLGIRPNTYSFRDIYRLLQICTRLKVGFTCKKEWNYILRDCATQISLCSRERVDKKLIKSNSRDFPAKSKQWNLFDAEPASQHSPSSRSIKFCLLLITSIFLILNFIIFNIKKGSSICFVQLF